MKNTNINRWELFRDTVIFQLKLGLDALRDLFLSPVSILLALYDVIKGKDVSTSLFYKLMEIGHKSDHWINLFGYHQRGDYRKSLIEAKKEASVDDLFAQVESLLKEQHIKGGLTASAKTSIDKYLNKIINNQNSAEEENKQNND